MRRDFKMEEDLGNAAPLWALGDLSVCKGGFQE
jgi:hypothetical protein